MKFAIVLGLALCLLAVHAQVPEKDKGAVQRIVEAAVAKVQKIFDATIKTVQGLIEKVFAKVNTVIESINSCIEKTKQAIKDKAAASVKFAKCLEEQKPALIELEQKAKAEIVACEKTAIDKKLAVVEGLKNEAATVQKEVGQAVAKCFEDHPFTALLCATKDAGSIYVKATISAPKSLLAAKAQIFTISVEALKCLADTKTKMESEAANIMKQIEACASAA